MNSYAEWLPEMVSYQNEDSNTSCDTFSTLTSDGLADHDLLHSSCPPSSSYSHEGFISISKHQEMAVEKVDYNEREKYATAYSPRTIETQQVSSFLDLKIRKIIGSINQVSLYHKTCYIAKNIAF